MAGRWTSSIISASRPRSGKATSASSGRRFAGGPSWCARSGPPASSRRRSAGRSPTRSRSPRTSFNSFANGKRSCWSSWPPACRCPWPASECRAARSGPTGSRRASERCGGRFRAERISPTRDGSPSRPSSTGSGPTPRRSSMRTAARRTLKSRSPGTRSRTSRSGTGASATNRPSARRCGATASACGTATRRRPTRRTVCATRSVSRSDSGTLFSTTGSAGARSWNEPTPTGRRLRPGREGAIRPVRPDGRGPLTGDDEVDEGDVDHREPEPRHEEPGPRLGPGPGPGQGPVELEEGGDGEDHQAVGPGQETGVEATLAHRLGLGTHVTSKQEADEGEEAQVRVRKTGDGESEDHDDIRIPVEDVVQEVAAPARSPRGPGDLAVEDVEEAGQKDQERDGEEEERGRPAYQPRKYSRPGGEPEGQPAHRGRAPRVERAGHPRHVRLDPSSVALEDHPR